MYLLDTNIISENSKMRPHLGATRWFMAQDLGACYLSVLTLGEIVRGIKKVENQSTVRLRRWLAGTEATFADRIIHVDKKIALCWGEIVAYHPNHSIDMFIAATAITRRLTLITRNERDFSGIPDLKVFNPFHDAL